MKLRPRRTLSGLVVLAAFAAPSSASAVTVTVRAESPTGGTVIPAKSVETGSGTFVKNGVTCSRTSVAGALEVATSGSWDGAVDPTYGQQIDTILGETHTFSSGRYWSVYVADQPTQTGNCDPVLSGGEEVLFAVACAGATTGCYADGPLNLTGVPARVAPGASFTVTVQQSQYDANYNYSTTPSSGATVTAAGQTSTTGPTGTAAVSTTQRGPVVVRATKGSYVPESATVCVTDGADGFCGTSAPGGGSGSGTTTTPASTTPTPAATSGPVTAAPIAAPSAPDKTAPRGRISGLRSSYAAGQGPKTLTGTITEATAGGARRPDQSGLKSVSLRLTRKVGRRCTMFSFTRERFVKAKCGADNGRFYVVGKDAKFSYLLPSRLGPGRYVLDVLAQDNAGNKDLKRVLGANRVAFTVR